MALQDILGMNRLLQPPSWPLPPPSKMMVPPPFSLSHGTTTLAFRCSHGVVVAADTRSSCKGLICDPASRKVITLHQHLIATTSGTSADCTTWLRILRCSLRLRHLHEGQLPSVAGAAKLLARLLYGCHSKDLCVATLLCGWDRTGPSLHYVYSNGTCLSGDVFSVGSGSPYAYAVLDGAYHYDLPVAEAFALARQAVAHATRRDAYSGGNVDLYHVQQSGWICVSREDVGRVYQAFGETAGKEGSCEEEQSGKEQTRLNQQGLVCSSRKLQ